MHFRGVEGTFAWRAPGVPSIQMTVSAIYHNALPPNVTPSSSPGTLSTSTLHDCWQSITSHFFTQQMGRSAPPRLASPRPASPCPLAVERVVGGGDGAWVRGCMRAVRPSRPAPPARRCACGGGGWVGGWVRACVRSARPAPPARRCACGVGGWGGVGAVRPAPPRPAHDAHTSLRPKKKDIGGSDTSCKWFFYHVCYHTELCDSESSLECHLVPGLCQLTQVRTEKNIAVSGSFSTWLIFSVCSVIVHEVAQPQVALLDGIS